MATCLLGLGSNLGDREATLAAALTQIDALPNAHVVQHSTWHRSRPLGGPPDQGEFLNAAALIETTIPPLELLSQLQGIETRHGRERTTRWSPRTLDIDVLLYGNEVSETEMLTLPHPRMSFRRFVLQPAAEIAPKMLHPVIGWPIERLLLHLDAASDQVALVLRSLSLLEKVAGVLTEKFGADIAPGPTFATAEQLWPAAVTSWYAMRPRAPETKLLTPSPLPYAAAAFPKLTILIDDKLQSRDIAPAEWSAIVRRPGRGPTLRLQEANESLIHAEVAAAIESVWPSSGPPASGSA